MTDRERADNEASVLVRRSYLYDHPLLFVLALSSTITALVFLLVPGTMSQSIIGVLFLRSEVATILGTVWTIAMLFGGLSIAYGIVRMRPDVEGMGLVLMSTVFLVATLAEVVAGASQIQPLATGAFMGLTVGHALRAVVIVRTLAEAQKALGDA